jgi:hypothetical protein
MIFALGLLYLLIKIEVSIMPRGEGNALRARQPKGSSNSLTDSPVYYKLAVELGKVYPGSVFVGNVDEFIDHVGFMQQGVAGARVHPDLRAVVTQCNDQQPGALPPKYTVQTLIPYLQNFSKLEYPQLANNLGALGVKTLVLANNHYVTQAGRDAIKQSLSQVPHEVFVSWAKNDGTGTATFKDKSNKTYDLILEPDSGDNCKIALMPSGISGVSAGDSSGVCPAPVKDQIIACLEGAIGIGVAGLVTCGSNPTPAGYPICVARAAFIGCGGRTLSVASKPCIENAYSSILGDSNNSGSGGWDVNADTLPGTSVSTDINGNPGDFDLGNL